MLVIMDGWGLGKVPGSDAIQQAKTPFVSSLYQQYPHTTLVTCGEAVGLPEGQMGNSEVGHLNLGAGRIVYQELQRINVAVKTGELAKNSVLNQAIELANREGKNLHLLGLVSDGGVHSHLEHLKAITRICQQKGCTRVFIHAFTDGRDTDPKSGLQFIKELESHLEQTTGKIATICGRYYAMDRDKRWERVKLAYEAMVHGQGALREQAQAAVEESYQQGITDEFIKPIVLTQSGKPLAKLCDGDVVICFNFRTDRCREITEVLTQHPEAEQAMHPLQLHYVTMTEYDKTYKGVSVIFKNDNLINTLGEVLARHHKKQIRIAETEKYPHVSFFFSGGREVPFEGEQRLMIPSPKVATYDRQPEMSAASVTEAIVAEIKKETTDFVCLNYANADMVGHTGIWEAAIKAVETVDACVQQVVTTALEHGYTVFLTADHGNADYMINEDGTPNTAHTLNPVPLIIIDSQWRGQLKPGKLADIAPTILSFMQLPIPAEMTGEVLV
jgi:2,3-bisphosphoglycerate-independent phosphoglycerate mutase